MSYLNGLFIPPTRSLPLVRPVAPTTTAASSSAISQSSSAQHATTAGVAYGDFAETTGQPTQGQWRDFEDPNSANPELTKAQYRSQAVLGVVVKNNNNQAHVVHAGVAFAWVTRGALEPPLSGIYEKSINGVFDSHVVIDVHPDDSFTMAATHDNELIHLKQRLDALTKPPS